MLNPPRVAALFLLVLIWAPCQALAQGPSLVVIAHPSVPVTVLDRNQLRALFALRIRTWPDGQAVSVVVFPPDSPIHRRFATQLLHIFPYQLQRAWDRIVYAGLGQGPRIVQSEPDMERAVASIPGAIGYLGRRPHLAGLRVLEISP